MGNLTALNTIISSIIQPLNNDKVSSEGEVFRFLFLLAFDDLKAAEVGNPLIHHLIVLKHMVNMAQEENLNMLHAGAIAILHDIAPIKKIRKVDLKTERSAEDKRILEDQRRHHRITHMQEGCRLAKKKLLLLNEYMGKKLYIDKDVDAVCKVISIHDNPSIDIPIPKDDHMAVTFREADRLWMLSNEGFTCDLQRDSQRISMSIDKRRMASDRMKHIVGRFQEERKLYNSSDGLFQDDELFFRTKTGFRIYLKYIQERKDQYGIQ